MKMEYIIGGIVVFGLLIGSVGTAIIASGQFSLFGDDVSQEEATNCEWKKVDVNGYTFQSKQDYIDYAKSQTNESVDVERELSGFEFKTIDGTLHGRVSGCE